MRPAQLDPGSDAALILREAAECEIYASDFRMMFGHLGDAEMAQALSLLLKNQWLKSDRDDGEVFLSITDAGRCSLDEALRRVGAR